MLSLGFYLPLPPKRHKFVSQMGESSNCSLKTLKQTFTVDVKKAENRPLNVPLISPFTIASCRLDQVKNVAVRIELSDGSVGWGEAPILPRVTAEDQATAMVKAREACEILKRIPAMGLGSVLEEIACVLPGHQFASVSISSFLLGFICWFKWWGFNGVCDFIVEGII